MKTKITLLIFGFYSLISFGQDKSYDLLKNKSETKIIYDKVFGISNATELKKEDITSTYFFQVYHEMQRADFLNRLPKLETLKEAANLGFAQNQVPLSILITDFDKISQKSINNGDLVLNADQQFEPKQNVQTI